MARCGAKTRSGHKCKAQAMPNGRCRMHGGGATQTHAGNQNARKHGIYSDAIMPDEAALWDQIDVGSLDDDIKIAKLQLRRALIAQGKASEGDGLELCVESVSVPAASEEQPEEGGPAAKSDQPTLHRQRRRRDYEDIINRLLGRIGDLESRRADMLKKLDEYDEELPPTRVEVVVRDARKRNA